MSEMNEGDNDTREHATNSNTVDPKDMNEQNEQEEKPISAWLDEAFGSGNNGNVVQVMNSLLNDKSTRFIGYFNIQDKNDRMGIVEKGPIRIQVHEEKKGGYQMIVADCDMKKNLIVWNANSKRDKMGRMDMDLDEKGNGWEECGVIDLNNSGRHWEGGVLNGCKRCCCGYGKEYNDENNAVYEGFMFGGKRVCYGKEYRGIRNTSNGKNGLIYEGGYWNGARHGFGKSYNLNGDVEYEGEWANNHPIHQLHENITLKNGDSLFLPPCIEEVTIGTNAFNDENTSSINLSSAFTRLKKIEIGDDCFKYVREFLLDGLEQLERVKIGSRCFRIAYEKRDDGVFRITNCPNFTQLELGEGNFWDFKQFELSNVNSLQSIQFGYCFMVIREFVLDGLERLESARIGVKSFRQPYWEEYDDGVCRITNCPNLTQLEFGNGLFRDFHQFELSNVNSLQSIRFGCDCFQYIDCILKDLPSLQQISFIEGSFRLCHVAQFENLPNLTTISYGDGALQGDRRNNRKPTINGHKSYHNTLIMKNLPLLTKIQCQTVCRYIHYRMGRVILENIPNLTQNNIDYGKKSYYYTADLQATNADELANYIRNQTKHWERK